MSKYRTHLRRERRVKNKENYFRNRRNWCLNGGPLIVMDEPTEDHVKALLMSWISPRKILAEVEKELNRPQRLHLANVLMESDQYVFDPAVMAFPDLLWRRLVSLATQPVMTEAPRVLPVIAPA